MGLCTRWVFSCHLPSSSFFHLAHLSSLSSILIPIFYSILLIIIYCLLSLIYHSFIPLLHPTLSSHFFASHYHNIPLITFPCILFSFLFLFALPSFPNSSSHYELFYAIAVCSQSRTPTNKNPTLLRSQTKCKNLLARKTKSKSRFQAKQMMQATIWPKQKTRLIRPPWI